MLVHNGTILISFSYLLEDICCCNFAYISSTKKKRDNIVCYCQLNMHFKLHTIATDLHSKLIGWLNVAKMITSLVISLQLHLEQWQYTFNYVGSLMYCYGYNTSIFGEKKNVNTWWWIYSVDSHCKIPGNVSSRVSITAQAFRWVFRHLISSSALLIKGLLLSWSSLLTLSISFYKRRFSIQTTGLNHTYIAHRCPTD